MRTCPIQHHTAPTGINLIDQEPAQRMLTKISCCDKIQPRVTLILSNTTYMHPAETSPAQCDTPDILYNLFLLEDGLGILWATEDTTISAGSV